MPGWCARRRPPARFELFQREQLEAVAGVKQPLVQLANARSADARDGRPFMAIEQAMGTPRGREGAATYLRPFVEEMKASGFVASSLERSGQHDAVVAPPER